MRNWASTVLKLKQASSGHGGGHEPRGAQISPSRHDLSLLTIILPDRNHRRPIAAVFTRVDDAAVWKAPRGRRDRKAWRVTKPFTYSFSLAVTYRDTLVTHVALQSQVG